MKYPVIFRRKKIGTIIINAVFFVISAVLTAVSIVNGSDWKLLAAATAIFALTLAFNAYFGTEKTYAVYADKIVTLSKFLPKITITAEELAGTTYASETRDVLRVNYNTDEFDIEKLSGGSAAFAELGEGMWTMYINARDVDRPLEEVRLVIEGIKTAETGKL